MQAFKLSGKQFFGVLVVTAIFSVASSPVLAETADSHDVDAHAHHAETNQDWPGIYNGFLPCADCTGIKTTLALNKNGSYVLITQYVGKSDREFVEKGKFAAGSDGNTLVLTPRDSAAEPRQYAVAENQLVHLDTAGKRITGKLAERYILRRNDITSNPPSHSSHH